MTITPPPYAVLGALALALGACSSSSALSHPSPSAAVVRDDLSRPALSDASTSFEYAYFFESVASLAEKAPDIVVGTIVGERRKEASSLPDEKTAIRVLAVKVEKSVKDKLAPGSTIEVETPGWVSNEGQQERQLSDAAGLRLLVGDRVVLGVTRANMDPNSPRGLAFGAAAFVLKDGQVVNTGRDERLAREAESLTEQQLLNAVGANT